MEENTDYKGAPISTLIVLERDDRIPRPLPTNTVGGCAKEIGIDNRQLLSPPLYRTALVKALYAIFTRSAHDFQSVKSLIVCGKI